MIEYKVRYLVRYGSIRGSYVTVFNTASTLKYRQQYSIHLWW